MKAFLILEDGTEFKGTSIGSTDDKISEIVFNTSMSGYLEVLADPSCAGQSVVMTYPLIGNYGVTPDGESKKAWADGVIVRELSRRASNFRCEGDFEDFLKEQNVTGICGIDTRALTKLLREKGSMRGMITTNDRYDLNETLKRIKEHKKERFIDKTTVNEVYVIPGEGAKVALLDLGQKANMIASLKKRGCEVMVYSAFSKAEDILKANPDGILIANGPGNPEDYPEIVKEVQKLTEADVPMLGVGLGHLFVACAMGCKVHKLLNGHRGGNYPVKDLRDNRVYISAQNHGYAVDESSLEGTKAVLAFANVNDGTIEGLTYEQKQIMTVQFSPETGTGQIDLGYVYDKFMNMMKGEQ